MASPFSWRIIQKKMASIERRHEYVRLLAFVGALVALTTTFVLMRRGIAVTHTEQVLDCHYEGVAAHTHYAECFDDEGNLVCPLPELELHKHDESCYDAEGDLVCGKEEVLEEHVHGPGCFVTVQVPDEEPAPAEEPADVPQQDAPSASSTPSEQVADHVDYPEPTEPEAVAEAADEGEQDDASEQMPAQTFTHNFEDDDNNLMMRVQAEAPEGALPAGSAMQVTWITPTDLTERQMDAVERAVAKKTDGKVCELQAVDISFVGPEGEPVEPAEKVTVTLTSGLADTKDQPYVVHVDDLTESQEKKMAEGGKEPKRTAAVVESFTERELEQREMVLEADQLAFESNSFSTYVLTVTTKDKVLEATDGSSYTVTVNAPASAGVSQDAKLQVRELGSKAKDWTTCLPQIVEALGEAPAYMRLFDLSIVKGEQEVQPAESVQVQMQLDDATKLGDDVYAVHVVDGHIEVLEASASDGTVSFDATGFSLYAIVGKTIEQTVLASDGNNYRISVTYGEDAGIPEDAELAASEVTGKARDEYIGRTSVMMDAGGFDYARVFDISIVDGQGEEVQPTAPVDVSIELLNAKDSSEDFSVVHFAGDEEEPEQMNAATDGNVVSFSANGFSAYAIVQGPSAVPIAWNRLANMADLATYAEDGIYIGHTDGYYLSDEEGTATNNAHGIVKTKPAQAYPPNEAAKYYFEAVEGQTNRYRLYCLKDGVKYYIENRSNEHLYLNTNQGSATAFTVVQESNGRFSLQSTATNRYLNNWQDASGIVFACWTAKNNGSYFYLWHHDSVEGDPYDLGGKTYGLMNWAGGVAGKAMMASETGNTLDAKALTLMSKPNNSSQLFVPNDSDISMWTFHWIDEDKYYLTTVENGSTKYLKIAASGLSLVSSQDEASQIQVVPGTATHAGEICLKSGNTTLTFSGTVAGGFSVGGSVGSEWLHLVELSEMTADHFLTYSATKVSVSDESITDGSRVIVYTRSWDPEKLHYNYYAISSDGTLVPVYEAGDSIEWVSGQINSLLWNLVEYYWEGTDTPNHYYELFNQYSEKYIAPQVTDGQILSDNTVGINLPGRTDGKYYTSILAWDEDYYSYAGLKVEDGRIVTCPKSESMDFYFAVMQDMNVDDTLSTVNTIDNNQFGITMKIKDYTRAVKINNNQDTSQEQHDVLGTIKYVTGQYNPGLLSTNLGPDGYPIATATGKSLSELYTGATEVNHLFIESTYNASGYYEFDSAQNFAYLDGTDFTVYRELGTTDKNNNKWSKHGQFLPLNNIEAGRFASTNPENLYTAAGALLDNSDPRKYERLYLVTGEPNYYYGLELEASFTQTPNGLDAWDHDIIYEFNGDDDFWLYVDGELVIDLGGIHDAMPGSVNFRTGDVYVNGVHHTLRELFEENYRTRNPQATNEEVAAHLAQYFDGDGTVFKDNTNHTMKIFYMERGAGAANLFMKFNLAAIKKGTVQLSKSLSGVDESDVIAEFPYQIWYKYKETEDGEEQEARLTNATDPNSTHTKNYVFYKDTIAPVKYRESIDIDGTIYNDVFFLRPGEAADISFPEGMTSYRIVECGVSSDIYSSVTVNGTEIEGTPESDGVRKDYGIDYETTDNRAKVNYTNEVNPDALRTLTIKKFLYDETGENEIDSNTEFTFRLFMASEFDDLELADMHTYHVKDPQGYYCRWNSTDKEFVRITGEGVGGYLEYEDMSAEQKASASFTTSIYGTIGRIKPGYTVVVRDVLAGTKYRVEERKSEIPDGYSFQRYDNYENKDGANIPHAEITELDGVSGVNGTVVADVDPNVDVRNLKGWGLRVNKVWSDKDYMSDRDPTYFAVFIDENHGHGQGQGDGHITLVDGTVRQLPYGDNPQTLYWYFDKLADGKGIDNYIIREVTLTGNGWTVNGDGTVSGADHSNVHPIHEEGILKLSGTQKGEASASEFDYTVLYERGQIEADSNVRVDTVTNNRPGIVLKKTQWDGTTPLAGTTFELKDQEGDLIGTFTSDEAGMITTAFLRDDVNYTLTETDTPQGWYGLPAPLTITLNNKTVTASGVDGAYYVIDNHSNHSTMPSLTIKNRPYTFQAVKKDGDTDRPLANVRFALHKQVTVDDVTTIDVNPMPGYETLNTLADGSIPKIDNTLPAGVYELREKTTPSGYETLSGYIHFSVSETGAIELIGTDQQPIPSGVTLESSTDTEDPNGTLSYVLNVRNYRHMNVILKKTDDKGTDLDGAKFSLCKYESSWEIVDGYKEIDMTNLSSISLSQLSVGRYRLTETHAPDGYIILSNHVYFNIVAGNSGGLQVVLTDESGTGENSNSNASVSGTVITVSNTSGVELPHSGGPGTLGLMATGAALVLVAGLGLLRRRKASAPSA